MKKRKFMYSIASVLVLSTSLVFFAFKKPIEQMTTYSYEVETTTIQEIEGQNDDGKPNIGMVPIVERKGVVASFSEDGAFEIRIKTLTPQSELYQQTKDFFQLNTEAEDLENVGEVKITNDGITVYDKNGQEIEKNEGDPKISEQIAEYFKGGLTNPETIIQDAINDGAEVDKSVEGYTMLIYKNEEGTLVVTIDNNTNLIVSKKVLDPNGSVTSIISFLSERDGDNVILKGVAEDYFYTNNEGKKVSNKSSSEIFNYRVTK